MIFPDFSPSPQAPALVIGAAGLDVVGKVKVDLKPGTSNPAQIRFSFGGAARNVAENLARLGQPTNLISAVGEDQVGDRLLEQLALAGVGTDAVLRTPDFPTGTYIAAVNSAGLLQFALDDINATSALTPQVILTHQDLFHTSSLVFIDANLPRDTLRTIFSLARKAHLPVCADPASVALASRLGQHLSRLRMVTPNSAEAAILCQREFQGSMRQEAFQAAKCLVAQGVELALVTLAELGVVYATSETSGHIPAVRTKIVDPTGAGDALSATVIFALLNDIPLDDAIQLGVTAAALTLQHRGTVIPDLSLEMLYDNLVV